MARLLRIQFVGAIYHVSVRGHEHRRIFKDDKDRERFLEQLAEARRLPGARLYLGCLMANCYVLSAIGAFIGISLTGQGSQDNIAPCQ